VCSPMGMREGADGLPSLSDDSLDNHGGRQNFPDCANTLAGVKCASLPFANHPGNRRRIIIPKDLSSPSRKADRLILVRPHPWLWLPGCVPGLYRRISQDTVGSAGPSAIEKT